MGHLIFAADNLGYSYDGVTALQDINLSIAAGEKVVILGANGSGKSTLLKLLDGLYYPSCGELRAFGKAMTAQNLTDARFASDFRRRVGLVFQDPDVQLFSPTVWDEVAFGPLQLGLPQDQVNERVRATLSSLGIEKLAERPPHRLSGGEKKKVAIASVLSMGQEVLLLDEPTASLDPRSQAYFIELVRKLNAEGVTIVTATQDLDSVEEIGDRAYVLGEDNHLAGEGTIEEILVSGDLLLNANLVHTHLHRHNGAAHTHPHRHLSFHEHGHKSS